MTDLIVWTTKRINRRRFVRRLAGGTFAVFAGAAVGVPRGLADPPSCQSPYNGGVACNPVNCSGSSCVSGGGATCNVYLAGCGGAGCWENVVTNKTCCDCQCRSGSFGWNCYCHG